MDCFHPLASRLIDMLLNWYGSISQGQGYSGSSEKMVVALDRLCDVRIMSFTKYLEQNLTEEGRKVKSKPFQVGDVGICYGFPNAFSSILNRVKIGFTMFETSKIPRSVVGNEWSGITGQPEDACNKLDALFVPSEHNKMLFEREGVTVPIHVVPLGVDTEHYKFMDRPKRNTFTFFMSGVLTIRKNPGAVLSAFLDLFKDNPDVRMVFKTHSGTMGHLQMPYKNVSIIDEYTTTEKMLQYFYDADCFVFPSRGEGFGLVPLEAMSTGLPVIVAKNTGMADYCDEKYNYFVQKHTMQKAVRFPTKWGDVGEWYDPDYNELKSLMKYVYEHQDEARAKGRLGAQWIRDYWTFDNTARKIIELVNKVLDK